MKLSKHIVIITPGFPANESDDSCIPPLQQFVLTFSEKITNYLISIISLHYPYETTQTKWNGISVYNCGGKNIYFPFRLLVWKRAANYFKKINNSLKVDLVHSLWLGECCFLGYKLSNKYDLPHINTLMGQELNRKNFYSKLINLDRVNFVTVSDYQSKIFCDVTKHNVEATIHWGVSGGINTNVNTERGIDILGVGSLTTLKNYGMFVKIISWLKEKYPNIKAVIAGDGEERNKIEQMILSLNLCDNIKLTGHLKRKEILDYMSKSKILLHTSSFESFGYVFAEALANGMYIVSFDVGIANPSDKWFVVKNENEMQENINTLLNKNLEHYMLNIFPIEETIIKYSELYERLIDGD